MEEPGRLVQTLTGAILGCGGWVLSRGANDAGAVNMLFEFERQTCVDIYSVLIAAGLDLSRTDIFGSRNFANARVSIRKQCGAEIASIDLEIQTFPVETAGSGDSRVSAVVKRVASSRVTTGDVTRSRLTCRRRGRARACALSSQAV